MCPAYRARNETAANYAVVIDIGWNGKSRVGLNMKHLTRRRAQGQAVLAAGTARHSNT
ncbi:hypothetical protein GCM10027596_40040 [Nocardioides korecus]